MHFNDIILFYKINLLWRMYVKNSLLSMQKIIIFCKFVFLFFEQGKKKKNKTKYYKLD